MIELLGVRHKGDLATVKKKLNSQPKMAKELDKLKKKIAKVKEEEKELQSDIPKGEVVQLSAYVVQELKSNTYEISFTEYNEWIGEIPTDDRALLETTETAFESRGLFELLVVEKGEREVQLAEEAGSFTANVPVYEEIPSTKIDSVEKLVGVQYTLEELNAELKEKEE